MRLPLYLVPFLASSQLGLAAPVVGQENVDTSLRLIKTSETDPGTWVTEEEKLTDYVAKGIGFIDITDISVSETHDGQERSADSKTRTMKFWSSFLPLLNRTR